MLTDDCHLFSGDEVTGLLHSEAVSMWGGEHTFNQHGDQSGLSPFFLSCL